MEVDFVFSPTQQTFSGEKIWQLWRFLATQEMLFRHQGLLHDARCPLRKVPTQDLLAFFVQWCHLPLFLIFQIPWRFWSKCLKLRVLQIFLKDFLGPETARKGTNSSSKRNLKTVIRSIYFHIKFGGKKRQHNNAVSGIDGKDGSLFLFCPKNSFFVLPIRESPPAMKLPAQVTMEISSYVSETCPKGLPTFSFYRRFKCQHWFTQKRAQLYIRLCFLERFLADAPKGTLHHIFEFLRFFLSPSFSFPEI